MEENKFLIYDASGSNPILHSIEKGMIKINDVNILLDQSNVQSCMTYPVLQEVKSIYSKTPDHIVFKHNQFSTADTEISSTGIHLIEKCELTLNGTTAAFENRDDLEFKVFNAGDTTSQTYLWQTSIYLSKLSPQDKSNIYLAIELLNSGTKAAILANDGDLRKQLNLLSIPVYGSSSFLAGMVLNGIYTDEEATKIYYEWEMIDPRWVPKDFSFKDVLYMERKRVKYNKSFWLTEFNFRHYFVTEEIFCGN